MVGRVGQFSKSQAAISRSEINVLAELRVKLLLVLIFFAGYLGTPFLARTTTARTTRE